MSEIPQAAKPRYHPPPAQHPFYHPFTHLKLAAGLVGLYSPTKTAGKCQQQGSSRGICRLPTRHARRRRSGSPAPPALSCTAAFPIPRASRRALSSLRAPRSRWQCHRHRPPGQPWPCCEMAPAPILASPGATPERPRSRWSLSRTSRFQGHRQSFLGMDKW